MTATADIAAALAAWPAAPVTSLTPLAGGWNSRTWLTGLRLVPGRRHGAQVQHGARSVRPPQELRPSAAAPAFSAAGARPAGLGSRFTAPVSSTVPGVGQQGPAGSSRDAPSRGRPVP